MMMRACNEARRVVKAMAAIPMELLDGQALLFLLNCDTISWLAVTGGVRRGDGDERVAAGIERLLEQPRPKRTTVRRPEAVRLVVRRENEGRI